MNNFNYSKHSRFNWYPSKDNSIRARITILLLLLLSGINGIPANAAGDGKAVLQKCLTAYQRLTSYSGKSVLTTSVKAEGKTVQSAALSLTMEMKRPNKLHISIMSPKGSDEIYSDGQTLFVYDISANQYTKGPSAPTLEALLPELFRRAHMLALIDPLGFMSRPQLPKELASVVSLPDSTYNGHAVYVLSGQTKSLVQYLKNAAGKSVTLPVSSQNWKWTIDKATLLFDKIEIDNPNVNLRSFKRDGKKIIPILKKVVSTLKNTISDCKPNAALDDSKFVFTMPAGATEHRTAEDILKGAK